MTESSLFNFRDVANYSPQMLEIMHTGKLFRSGVIPKDTNFSQKKNISNVIDLRTKFEINNEISGFVSNSIAFSFSNSGPKRTYIEWAKELSVKEISVKEIYESVLNSYIRMFIENLSLIRNIINYIIQIEGEAVLIHCSAGKDRTGIVIASLLELIEVPIELIKSDYEAAVECSLSFSRSKYKLEFIQEGLNYNKFSELIEPNSNIIQDLFSYLNKEYGSLESIIYPNEYIRKCNLVNLRRIFLK